MKRKKSLWLAVASALLSALLIYAIYMFQLKQIQLQDTILIAVPTQFIDAGTLITNPMVEMREIVLSAFDERYAISLDEIIGYEAVVPLAKNEPIYTWKLDKYRLMPRQGQATFQLPREYILSISDGIRAGDRIQIYVSGPNHSHLLFEDKITVASVKTAGNAEIDSHSGSSLLSQASGDFESLYVSRRSANGAIHHINVHLTEEQWLMIDQWCRKGEAKLVIAYTHSDVLSAEIM